MIFQRQSPLSITLVEYVCLKVVNFHILFWVVFNINFGLNTRGKNMAYELSFNILIRTNFTQIISLVRCNFVDLLLISTLGFDSFHIYPATFCIWTRSLCRFITTNSVEHFFLVAEWWKSRIFFLLYKLLLLLVLIKSCISRFYILVIKFRHNLVTENWHHSIR